MSLHVVIADGQKIAKRLSMAIKKESKKTKGLLDEYTATSSQLTEQYTSVSVSEVASMSSEFWVSLAPNAQKSSAVPWHTQRDIIQASLLMKRSKEEITLLEQDMQNVISYWEKRKQCINSQIQSIEVTGLGVSELFNRGAMCLLRKRLWEAELFYNDALSSFSSVINVTSHSNTGSNDVSQSFSDDDSGSDDEYDTDMSDFDDNDFQ